MVAVGAAGLAAVLLLVFVQQYRRSVSNSAANTPVFVSSGYIPRGTSADLVASNQLIQRTLVKSAQVQVGAIADPSVLHGQVAATDIYPGQQITAADFTGGGVTIGSQLTQDDRAIAVPVDTAHGLTGFLHAGDHVDLLASFGGGNAHSAVSVLAQNVLVLSTPATGGGGLGGGNGSGNIVLRVSPAIAQAVAYAADNGKVWVTLRPPADAIQSAGN
jgi:Flp pilus assembly protein CpaB